jgi:purine-binding chemotaxis protein CheW
MSVAALFPAQVLRACLISLAETPFAVDVRVAKEVVVFDHCTPVPHGSRHLLGVGNLRGSVIPVLDIQPLLGLPERQVGGRLAVLVVSCAAQNVAVAVDRVLGLERFAEVVPFSQGAKNVYGEYAVGLLPRLDDFVPLLNIPRLVEALRIANARRSERPPVTMTSEEATVRFRCAPAVTSIPLGAGRDETPARLTQGGGPHGA